MNDMTRIVALISLLGWLVLVTSGYRTHRVSGRNTLLMAALWMGIFGMLVIVLIWLGA